MRDKDPHFPGAELWYVVVPQTEGQCVVILSTHSTILRPQLGPFRVHPQVASALADGDPVVALETTILTHGMPRPQNLETALRVEEVVRSAGAVPATIGVLDGTVHVGRSVLGEEGGGERTVATSAAYLVVVGMTPAQLEELATSERVHKISQRDLAYCISQVTVREQH